MTPVVDRDPSRRGGFVRQLSHERLDVYQKAIEFFALSVKLLDAFPKGNRTLADQLKRASLSTLLNIAEAAGKPSPAEGRHHFAIARGSALECAAALDAVLLLGIGEGVVVARGKDALVSVVSMLSKMCRAPGALSSSSVGSSRESAYRDSESPASHSGSRVAGTPSASRSDAR
jgi:four helix bundle protein